MYGLDGALSTNGERQRAEHAYTSGERHRWHGSKDEAPAAYGLLSQGYRPGPGLTRLLPPECFGCVVISLPHCRQLTTDAFPVAQIGEHLLPVASEGARQVERGLVEGG